MSYKIVAAKSRRGGIEITLSPSALEQNNILKWPRKKVTQLQKEPESKQEPQWQQYLCVVKKTAVETYEEALEWESAYQNANTDGESELIIFNKTRKILKEIRHINHYERLFEGINENLAPNSANPDLLQKDVAYTAEADQPVQINSGTYTFITNPSSALTTNIIMPKKPMQSKLLPSHDPYLSKSNAYSHSLIDLLVP